MMRCGISCSRFRSFSLPAPLNDTFPAPKGFYECLSLCRIGTLSLLNGETQPSGYHSTAENENVPRRTFI